jgi:hypothetical protein
MPIKIFGEFMRFFPKGLNTFKIQTIFKLDLLLNFIFQNPERFGSSDKKEIYLFWIDLPPCQVWRFFEIRRVVFCIFELGALELIGKRIE